ncbi:unnamed protein product [Anisakis simplex]|uniref:DUF5641 domain-containing protein n=1 Tax=Anisakis simplex TaxID=6269 RepID=A0A0M3IZX3_ANISI|nr:unnamed protein product [Anisakis simplex]
MQWHANTDHLTLTMKPPPTAPITKRSLLRYIAQFFDPLGFQAPVIITYKILLQDITKTGADWDEPLKPQYQNQWSRLQAYYSQSPIKIARLQPMAMAELHIFADASSRAYATAIYFKQENQVTLFYAKARLCPIKGLTIPQLELLAILISVRASNFIIKQLNLVNIKRTIWTDSKCALAWINSGSSEKLSRYVRNRLNEVRLTKDIAYAYVPTEDNPADVATRGLSWENFITEDKWWNGPRWLRNDQSKWPFTPTVPAHGNENTPDPPSKVASNASTVIQCLEPTQFIDAKKFSSWTRLVDIVAWMLRFLHNARHSTNTYLDEISSTGLLSANDRRIAEHYLIRQVQNSSISTKEIQRWQLIQDAKGIWRCHGRLAETVLPRAEQFPIFLPRGVYERLIGLTKNCMRKAVGRRLLTDATLRTFVTEVEAVLNERPLTYVENENIEVLRPIDYLRPRAHLALSMKENAEMEAEFNPHPPSTRQQFLDEWRKSEEYRNKFWIIWSREYLQLLREREQQLHKGPYAQERRTPRIGEVVLLNEQNRPRCMWRLARIVETPEGSGHAIRTARIKLATGRTLVRSIAHLYPLEVTLTDTIANNSTPTPKQTQFPRLNSTFTHHTTILTIVSLIMLAVPAQSTFSAQLCPYKQTGIFMRLPPPINCTSNVIQNWSRQQAAVYRRHLIPLNATFCSKYTRTVCTWAFLRWSLQVVSDVHSIDSVPLKDCQKLHQQKSLGSIELQSTNSSHKWTSRNPVHYSYAFFGEDCQSTVNYAVEEGEVVLFDGHSSIDSFTRTKGCSPKQNHCFTAHETIMWNISDLHSQCQYKLDGIYAAQVSSTEIFVHILQEAFVIIPKQPALLQGCHITNPVYTENDIVISFDSPETHDPLQDDDAVAQEESRIFMQEKIKGRPNIINPVLQYLQDIERKRNALKWCSVKNEFHAIVRWISIHDPTSAVRLLLGRSDVSARQVGHTLLVSKCHRVPATDIRWDHHRNGKCFERLPVTIDGRNVFVEPYTHDVVTESQELSCTLYKLPVNVSEIADNNLEILTNRTIQTIFNAKQPKDISLQFIHLALDHLQSSNLAYEESSTTNQTQRSWWTSSEEQLKELGHQVEKTTEEISQTLISVAHYWRWITAGGALVITAAAAVFICVQCPVKELQTPFSQQESTTDAEMSDSPPLQTTDRKIRPVSHYPYKPPAIPNSLRGPLQRKQHRNSSNF